MGRREAYAPGSFCWADVGAADREAAKTFFAELFGWAHEDQTGSRGNVYTFLSKDGAVVAGLREGPPFWLSYVSVEDLDATLAQAREAGAALQDEPYEVAPAGRMAVLDDPQGAAFGLWQAYDFPGAGLVNDVGAMVWQHLATNDVDAAKDWYSGLFGWTWEELEGAPGWWNARGRDGRLAGSVAVLPVGGVPPNWQVSFTVEDAVMACERVEQQGGSVTLPRMDTPVGGIAVVSDPQGAPMGLFDGVPEP